VASSPEERVRELCELVKGAEGAERDIAISDLQSALTALLSELKNVSQYNLIKFPAAMEKRRKA
jgi:hypothetical protein